PGLLRLIDIGRHDPVVPGQLPHEFKRFHDAGRVEGRAGAVGRENTSAVLIYPTIVSVLPLREGRAEFVDYAVTVGILRQSYCRAPVIRPRPFIVGVGDIALVEQSLVVYQDERNVSEWEREGLG